MSDLTVSDHAVARYAQRILHCRRLARTHADQLRIEIAASVRAGHVKRRAAYGIVIVHNGAHFLIRNGTVVTVLTKRCSITYMRGVAHG